MRKVLFFAFAALALVFTACDKNNPDQPVPSSKYDGIWVSDSILNDNSENIHEAVFVEVLNSKQVLFHGQEVATYEIYNEHFFTITFSDSVKVEGEIMDGEDEHVGVYVWGQLDHIGIWSGVEEANLFMYHLPQPQGSKLPVTEANILGKWRTTYEINASYNSEGKKDSETKFYHGWEIWDIQANGVATAYSDPYSYNGWWAIDGDKLALSLGDKPATIKPSYYSYVELYSNFMHIIDYTYREDGVTISSSNEQFLYRVK